MHMYIYIYVCVCVCVCECVCYNTVYKFVEAVENNVQTIYARGERTSKKQPF